MAISPVLNFPDETRMIDVLRTGLADATHARMSVAFTVCSGLQLLVDPLQELLARDGKADILTSTYQSFTQPAALETLLLLSDRDFGPPGKSAGGPSS